MMVKEISLIFQDGTIKKYDIKISTSEPWSVTIDYRNLQTEEDDLFEALLSLRKLLEREGVKILCNGSRKDVICSGMSRSMGGGRLAYIIEIGKPVKQNNLVDIFDYADLDLIGSIKDQETYHDEWLNSLRNL